MRIAGRGWAIPAVILPVGTALAEVSDKVGETRADQWIVTCALLLLTAVAAVSGWRRALLLWPLSLIWSQIVFWTAWAWFDEIRREGTLFLLWESGATAAALLLAPPLFAGLGRRWRRTGTAWASGRTACLSPPPAPGDHSRGSDA